VKSKLTWVSILLIIVFMGIQYWVTLQEHVKLPSSEWSRTKPLFEGKSDYASIQSVSEKTGTTITLKDLRKQDVLYCDADFTSCSKDRTITDGSTHKFTYNDQQQSIYIEGDQLVIETTEGKNQIAEASNFTVGNGKIAYWTEDFRVVVMDKETEQEIQTIQLKQPIRTGGFIDGQLIVLTEDVQSRELTGFLMDEKTTKLFSFKVKASENLQSIQMFSPKKDQFGILLDIEILAGGARSKMVTFATFTLEGEQQLQFNKLTFTDGDTGNRLEDVRNPNVLEGPEGSKIAFSASGFNAAGYSTRIFIGDFSVERIEAHAATKSGELFSRPHLVDEENLLIFSIDGKEKSLSYSSADPTKIAESNKVGEGDLKTALIKFVTLLMNGMLLLLVSFLWFIPTFGLTYGTQYVLRKMYKPISEQNLFYLHAAYLFGIQVIIFTMLFNVEPFVANIPFLNHVWQLILLLAGCILISLLPVLWIHKKVTEDNFNSFIMYLTFMNLVILLILTGPYFL